MNKNFSHNDARISSSDGDVLPTKKRSVPIVIGSTAPSPYIVKLAREEADRAALSGDIAGEIEALARSLIIEGEEDELPAISDDETLSVAFDDVLGQFREGDISPTLSLPVAQEKLRLPSGHAAALPRPSLDEALTNILEEPIPLEALVPLAHEVTIENPPHQERNCEDNDRPHALRQRLWRFEWGFLKHSAIRGLVAFVALSFAVVFPLHAMQTFSGATHGVDAVQQVGTAALGDVVRATSALVARDFGAAETDFSSAAVKFSQAEDTLKSLQKGIVSIVNVIPQTERTLSTVEGLMTAGREFSQIAATMSQAGAGITSQQSLDIVTKLQIFSAYIQNALPHALAAQGALNHVDSAIVPKEYLPTIARLQAQTPEMTQSMEEFLRFVDTVVFLLGGEEKMRYLALFQNNTELRATGGFVGSFAEIDMNNGVMTNMRLPGGGTYDVQGQLDAFVAAPKPLSLINARWEFQDGNWFPDFPTSAKKMQWFYEHAGGPTTDGVIAVNATFVEKLLAILGPIEMAEYGQTLQAENFLFTTQKIVEMDYDRSENAPKAFLGDLAPKLLEKIQSADFGTLLKILTLVEQGLMEKDIQVYFRNEDAQKAMQELGFAGAVEQTAGDYFMLIDSNIGGGKTDGVIREVVDIAVNMAESGTITNTVTLTKEHRGLASALFHGKNNVDYVRMYVPAGSVLLSAHGFEPPSASLFETSDIALTPDEDLALIMQRSTTDAASGLDVWEEFGKTVFGGWVQTAPGETQEIQLTYRLPQVMFVEEADSSLLARMRRHLGFDAQDAYSLLVQKQSGVNDRTTTVHINYPESWKTYWTNEDSLVPTTTFENTYDHFSGWLFTHAL